MRAQPVNIVGAGLAGPLLALLLAHRGFTVTVYERRSDPRASAAEAGRSINLALAARGIRALEHAGIMDRVRPLTIPMRGRMVHELGGPPVLLPYGQRPDEVIHSIGRGALNLLLIEEAARQPGVTFRFGRGYAGMPAQAAGAPVIAADGAGSAVRVSLVERGQIRAREAPLDHDYKELSIPPLPVGQTADRQSAAPEAAGRKAAGHLAAGHLTAGHLTAGRHAAGRHALEREALHVWPRRGFMLIALPNTDVSFTATLFLPREGPRSFASLQTPQDIEDFFSGEFPDAVPLIPDLLRQFREHPQGRLGTVHAAPWHAGGQALLLGDAAHAIVPFHGQGMNAAFEDCLALDALLDRHESWESLFAAFEAERRPNAEAIAQMAIENYGEMRESVLDPKFLRQKAWALELERRFPDRFIPRYSMVMFHPEISYAEALRRGAVQQQILDVLDERATAAGAKIETLDLELARRLILERL